MKRKFKNWVKYLFLGGLICTGISACSDDVLEGGENPTIQGDNTPAYLKVSFSTTGNGSRSTADDANNMGDQDGSAEDSGHKNAGTDDENTISDALVVIVPKVGNTALAKLYAIETKDNDSTTPNVGVVEDFFEVTAEAGTTNYTSAEPIQLSVGEYRVLVIANPPAVLTDLAFGDNSTKEESDVTKVKNLYQSILDGEFDASNMTKFTGSVEDDSHNDLAEGKRFMMANKGVEVDEDDNTSDYEASKLIKLTDANGKDNPAVAKIEVERAVAKITFRPKKMKDLTIDDNGNVTEGDELDENYYPVKVVFGNVKAKTISADVDNDQTEETLNLAVYKKDGKEQNIYVLIENGVNVYYTESNGTYSKLDITPEDSEIEYLYDDAQAQKKIWYVKLEEYALVNLMKKTNYVRHTISANGVEAPFGVLTGSNYLWTPYWDEINKVTFNANGEFDGTPAVDTWFWNTLTDVSAESKLATEPQNSLYQVFPWDASTDGDVTGAGDKQHQNEDDLENIGWTLDYVFENATDVEHQTHGLSTGISFKAKIYEKNASGEFEAIKSLYRYDGHLFESLKDMVQAYGANATTAMKDLANNIKEENAENLAAANIEKFAENVCYYYTTEIKHFDNGDPHNMGNMEFAIMRNNIYSLAVTGIKVIGDPFVDPTPSIPDESPESYLSVQVKIIPWIVRYHDIEFN